MEEAQSSHEVNGVLFKESQETQHHRHQKLQIMMKNIKYAMNVSEVYRTYIKALLERIKRK